MDIVESSWILSRAAAQVTTVLQPVASFPYIPNDTEGTVPCN